MHQLKVLGVVLGTVGLGILFMSAILPLVKLDQTLVKTGPNIQFDENISYWIDSWTLPPIDAGTPFSIAVEANSPGGLSIVILPSQEGVVVPGSSALLTHVFESTQQTLLVSTIVPLSSEYFISIVSFRNYYTLTITSKWSPFYFLRVFLYLGLVMLSAGFLVIYYGGVKERQERLLKLDTSP